MQFTEKDLRAFITDLLKENPDDKDFRRKIIDNLATKIFVGDGFITVHFNIGNGTKIEEVRLEEIKTALEHIFSVQTLSPLAQREGFEPPETFISTVFKTAAIDRSAISAFKRKNSVQIIKQKSSPPNQLSIICDFL